MGALIRKPKEVKIGNTSFKFVGASVAGSVHQQAGKNNQDYYTWITHESVPIVVAIQTDGCGSEVGEAKHELGSILGGNLYAKQILDWCIRNPNAFKNGDENQIKELILKKANQYCLGFIQNLAMNIGDSLTQAVREMFLFTVMGAIITPTNTIFFRIGADGLLFINQEQFKLPKYKGNEPAYSSLALVNSSFINNPEALEPEILTVVRTEQIERFAFFTDGGDDLVKNAGKYLPAQEIRLLHPLDILYDDAYFDAEGQNLSLLLHSATKTAYTPLLIEDPSLENQPMAIIKKHRPLIGDDCTVFMAKKI